MGFETEKAILIADGELHEVERITMKFQLPESMLPLNLINQEEMSEEKMKIIYKGVGKGKTTDCIKLSSETGAYIVCRQNMVFEIAKKAKNMKLKIPFPLSYEEFKSKDYYPPGCKGFIIDDVESLLASICFVKILAISLTKNEEQQP